MLIQRFEEQVKKSPDRIAIKIGAKYITYGELNRWANRIAHAIEKRLLENRKNLKRPVSDNVALLFEHGSAMIAAILGALKAGKVYVPFAADYPEKRLSYMLTDSQSALIVTNSMHEETAKNLASEIGIEYLDIDAIDENISDEDLPAEIHSDTMAYIMYTSGSTGRPKGVMQTHQNAVYYVRNWIEMFSITAQDRMTLFSSFCHDGSVQDMFAALHTGATLYPFYMRDREQSVKLSDFLLRERITIWHSVPSLFSYFVNNLTVKKGFTYLRFILLGGEEVREHEVNMFKKLFPHSILVNVYGQTESSVNSVHLIHQEDIFDRSLVGTPLDETKMFVVDQEGNEVDPLQVGEILVVSRYISPGYWRNEEATKKVFSSDERLGRLYWTGDLGRLLLDGNIEFLGRADNQIKIRGFRVEMGEIETRLLAHEAVNEVAVVAREDENRNTYLCAYVEAREQPRHRGNKKGDITVTQVREYLSKELPDYMIPAYVVQMDKLPLTPSGKIDRKRLPPPDTLRPQLGVTYVAPRTNLEAEISTIWKEVLKVDKVGVQDNFFDLGGNSFHVITTVSRLSEALKMEVSVVALFRYPTINAFIEYLNQKEAVTASVDDNHLPSRELAKLKERSRKHSSSQIAVIGMAGRFPGARSIEEFWSNLKNGVESISFFSTEELEQRGVSQKLLQDSNYVKARGVLAGIEDFDAPFFNYTPVEARMMDPQLRVLHECCEEALENAGYEPDSYNGSIGLYAGNAPNQHWVSLTLLIEKSRLDTLFLNNNYSTKVSYKLNLTGPSFIVQTACSTALVAIHLACQGLINGECEVALAGGVSIVFPDRTGYLYREGMILSPDGHCRVFDAKAGGTIFGNGVGIVTLKPLERALAEGDTIYAVIKGSAVNNDGNRKVGITAPSVDGQAEVIRVAHQAAEVEPESIGYIEAHGTGTILGDPVEIEALKLAFNTSKTGYCAIGSVKTNVGHLNSAAGAAGFIKAVLALKERLIPPSLNFDIPNPSIDFENSPFYVNTGLKEWQGNGSALRAGVSSFGIGGTNAHVVLEEAPEIPALTEVRTSRDYQLLLFSAKSKTALKKSTENFVKYLQENPSVNLADAAYTLKIGRKSFKHRRMLLCPDVDEAVDSLLSCVDESLSESPEIHTYAAEEGNIPVVFMFPGQGCQYVNMGLDLYQKEKIFRQEMDRCFEILKPLMGYDIKEVLYPDLAHSAGQPLKPAAGHRQPASDIDQTQIAQPVIFIFEYALAKLMVKWGIHPHAMIGHSIGEYAAACLSGVFSLEDALNLVVLRGRLTSQQPAGSMLSVPLAEEELVPLLSEELSLAAVNSSGHCVVSGSRVALDAFARQLREARQEVRLLHTSHAFHSQMMDPILEPFEKQVGKITLNRPEIPYISNVTGTWITVEQASNPAYWAKHLRQTVRFSDGAKELLKETKGIFVEVGPGHSLCTFVRQHLDKKPGQKILNLVRHPGERTADNYYLLSKLGQLWLYGVKIDWAAFYEHEMRFRIPLPGYPFEPQRYWLDVDRFRLDAELLSIGKEILVQDVQAEDSPHKAGEPGRVPGYFRPELSTPYTPPETDMEKTLVRIWQELMGIDQVGIHDDFFELGGDSLKAVTFIGKIHQQIDTEVPLSAFFSMPTIHLMAEFIDEKKEKTIFHPIQPVERREYYTLSPAQQRIYILHHMDKASTGYNLPSAAILEGPLDEKRVENTLMQMMKRHECFRTSFEMVNGEPVQRIHDEVEFKIEYYQSSEVDSFIKYFIRPFDLRQPPLYRLGLIKQGEDRCILVTDIHHLIFDGSSISLFFTDFMEIYRGRTLPPLKARYSDYSEWLNSPAQRELKKRQEEYWINLFSEEILVMDMPLDFPRPAVQSFEGKRLNFSLNQEITEALKSLAGVERVTLFMILLSIFNVLLMKLCGQEDIVVGTPTAGRNHPDVEQIVGVFINTLALRNSPSEKKTFREFLGEVKERTLKAFENQDYPFEELVEKLEVQRDISRNPLFDIMFRLHNFRVTTGSVADLEIGGLKLKGYEFDAGRTIFDLNFTAMEADRILMVTIEYCTKLYKQDAITRFFAYFKRIVAAIIQDPGIKLSLLDIVTEEEREQILYQFNDTSADYPRHRTIDRWLEEQVERTPNNAAVVGAVHSGRKRYEISQLTYRDLNLRADRLAWRLKGLGVKSGSIVGLMTERGVEMLIGQLAILKSGAAYLPIGPEYPAERIDYMLTHSEVEVILTSNGDFTLNRLLKVIDLATGGIYKDDETVDLTEAGTPTDLAYVIYTSGTTGVPKGVMIEHRSVINFIKGITDIIPFTVNDSILCLTTVAFDIFGLETILPLTQGARVVIGSEEEQLNTPAAASIIEKEDIHILQVTPSRLQIMVEHPKGVRCLAHLKFLLVGGEAFPEILLAKARGITSAEIYNMYGPTETTIWSTVKDLTGHVPLNIGKPIANTKIYIVNKAGRLQPVGIAGELCISGHGLARGYFKDSRLTDEKFVENPFLSTDDPDRGGYARMYRTGDLARWLADGDIQFLGRIDYQVKIRGFRIELGEIEKHLQSHQSIKEAVVIDRKSQSGDKYLCGYIVLQSAAAADSLGVSEIREFLSKKLPDYMIPAYFVPLEKIPLTSNGKIDRKALPGDEGLGLKAGSPYVEPSTETERLVVQIWQEVLRRTEKPGIEDNFFELGGDSLKAVNVISRVHHTFNQEMPLTEFFKRATVREVAEYIATHMPEAHFASIEPVERKEYYGVSSPQRRMYVLQRLENDSAAYNLPVMYEMEGDIDLQRLETTFLKLIRRHEILRASFHMIDGKSWQRIHDTVPFSVQYFDFTIVNDRDSLQAVGAVKESALKEGMLREFIRPFDLSKAPLIRVNVGKLDDRKYMLMLDLHHIIYDGTSVNVLYDEFWRVYNGEELPPLRIQYKDYSEWQNSNIWVSTVDRQKEFWLKAFQDEIPVLSLPYDYPRPMVQSYQGSVTRFELPPVLSGALRTLCLKENATLFMTIYAVYSILLSRLSGQQDIVIGTPVAGRKHVDLQRIIGVFLNTLTLRSQPLPEKTFSTFLREIREHTLQAFDNQDYPFEDLVDQAAVNRDLSRNPLFDAMFILHNELETSSVVTRNGATGFQLRLYRFQRRTSLVDITLIGFENADRLSFEFEYCTRLFKEATINYFITGFKRLISRISDTPGMKISQLEIISEDEQKKVLYDFNNTEAAYPGDKTIHRLIQEQVERTPDSIAAGSWIQERGGDYAFVSYSELNRQANRVAHLLRQQGVKPDTLIGILIDRSLEMLIGMLGILKAGGAYLPLDPAYPRTRLVFILEKSGTSILVTRQVVQEHLGSLEFQGEIIEISTENLAAGTERKEVGSGYEVSPTNLAYVIYTSGSTGSPKGVMITHQNVVNFFFAMTQRIEFKTGKTMLALTTISFDISVLELFLPLVTGMKVVIAGVYEQNDPLRLTRCVMENRVNIMQITPSHLKMLLEVPEDVNCFKVIEMLLVGGEAFPHHLFETLRDKYKGRIYNMYGPTETTIWSTVKDLTQAESIDIGSPIANTWLYILNRSGQVQPIGLTGELCIGGHGVSRGYLGNLELTAEKFIPDPYRSQELIYSTGDLARWLSDGEIEFLGRIDYQVKIRGFRIELEEIEEQLLSFPGINAAVVTAGTNEARDSYLAAYVVSNREIEVDRLREYLSRKLPIYMVPAYFVPLDSIPLTPNGKVDRKVLPPPQTSRPKMGTAYLAPATEMEKAIAEVWKEVLQIDKVGIYDSFFDLGGNSLNIIQLNTHLKEKLNIDIPIVWLFRHFTIGSFTSFLNENADTSRVRERKAEQIETLKQASKTYKDTVKRFKKGVIRG